MKIQLVTLTGADDSVEPSELYDLSATFPWVEWGVLYSEKCGRPRFPSDRWLTKLAAVKYFVGPEMKLAGHLCGYYVELVLDFNGAEGADPFVDRVQLNLSRARLRKVLQTELPRFSRPFILGGNYKGVENFDSKEGRFLPLFDASGGKGKLEKNWPKPFMQDGRPILCGYAGGLGPDNLADELKKIEDAVGDATIWIDMESSLRTDDRFDLKKCEAVLRTAEPWVV